VVWAAEGNKLDDGEAMCSDPGSGGGTVTDARSASYDVMMTSFFEVTPEGSVSGDNIFIEVRLGRNATSGSDTLNADAYLLGCLARWTSDEETDD